MKWILPISCILLATQAVVVPPERLSPQEAFFLRRMTEFWKDRDFPLVKAQILDFLASHDSSNIHNNLYALLGDILYQESDYAGALATYNKISDAHLIERTLSRKSQCLYICGYYEDVIQTLTPVFQEGRHVDLGQEMQFIFADSLFRKMRVTQDAKAQKELARVAKPFLLELFNTSYQDKVLLPLAEIHRELKESQEATPLYLTLADKMPVQKEELLLQAASLQLEFDPSAALTTFQTVVDIGGSRASEAAHQEYLLLFQNERHSELISRAPKIEMYLIADQKALFEFCLARCYFKLEQIPEAVTHFLVYLDKEREASSHKKAAYLTLIHCAQKTENSGLFDDMVVRFLNDFPTDEEAGKALLLHAQLALQTGNDAQASQDLERLLRDFPNFPDQETILYSQALLLSKTHQWGASRSAFLAYLDRFPHSTRVNTIWTSIVHSSVQELKEATGYEVHEKKQQLAADLTKALTLSDLFSSDEEAAYQFLLGQLMFDLNRYSEAVVQLDHFCNKYSNHPSVPDAYLVQALSHNELKSAPEVFIPIAEKALEHAEDPTHKTALRLQLFNAYLATKEHDKAADRLYQVFILEDAPVQQENQLWLASYFTKSNQEKAIQVFKKILLIDDMYSINFDPAQTYLEVETIKFAGLLEASEKEKVLKSLVEEQNRHPALPWKHQGTALLELAKAYVHLHKPVEALDAFEAIIAKGAVVTPSVRSAALLEKSRILLTQCQGADRNEENQNIRSILSTLKDLQIQKQLPNEPVHLEAALDYADLRTALSPEASRLDSGLFYLNRVKEDFNAKDDPIAQEYHEARLRYPEKDRLFQIYMKCIEGEILYCEMKEAHQRSETEKAERLKVETSAMFNEVLQDPEVTPYLKHRIEGRLNELR